MPKRRRIKKRGSKKKVNHLIWATCSLGHIINSKTNNPENPRCPYCRGKKKEA
jgi:hypothetical protein